MTERKLPSSDAALAAIVASSDDAIISKDTKGIILSWNRAAERIFGYTADEAIGRSIRMIIPQDRQAEEDYVLGRIISGKSVDHFETIRLRKDGTPLDISLTVSPIRDEHGVVIGASKIARDITEQKRLVDAERSRLIRERELQEEANRMKDEFLATLSHELRTPLNAIVGWSGLLVSGELSEQERELALRTIDRNARTQVQLVEDLLDVSRIISGKMRLEPGAVDLVEVAAAATDVMRPAAEAKRITVTTEWAEPHAFVHGDPDRLQQVAWNLIANAVKFTTAGGHVWVRVRRDEGAVVMEVQDDGKGIAPEFLPHVFDRFRQEESALTRTYGGLGLGLAIVRHIVEMHGGQVAVTSAGANQGSTFTIRLPALAVATPRRWGRGAAAADAGRLDGARILVVDDNEDDRQLLRAILSRSGAEIDLAPTVADGMSLLHERDVDAVITDLAMPVVDGYAFIRELRSDPSSRLRWLPAIAVTAHARAEDREHALSSGFNYYVAKPIDRARLIETVAEAVARKRAGAA